MHENGLYYVYYRMWTSNSFTVLNRETDFRLHVNIECLLIMNQLAESQAWLEKHLGKKLHIFENIYVNKYV